MLLKLSFFGAVSLAFDIIARCCIILRYYLRFALYFTRTPNLLFLLQDHACRSEGVELARELDYKSAAAWVGHPYFDVIDNSTDFETKMNRMIESVCQKLGIDIGDRLQATSRKLKYLGKLPIA